MQSLIHRLAATFSIIALAAALVSCGGGGGGSTDTSQAQGKGTVGILLTDKPADPAMFAAIIASIVKVELMGSEENGRVELYSLEPGDDPKEFDLLRLRNESIPLVFKDKVPAGTYCKIRLTLSQLELVLTNGTPNDTSDDTSAYPKLPGNGKLDLVVRDCFDVVAGEVLALQLDMDAGKSIHIVEKGNCTNKPDKCFNFRPVVFVDVIDKDFDSKLVRLNGVIKEVDSVEEYLLLCEALPSKDMDNEGCVKVHFGENSAFFDNVDNGGDPTSISDELLQDDMIGKDLTIVGWVKSWTDNDHDYDKPEAYYPLLYLEALVAESGEFEQIEGQVEALNNPVDTGFSMAPSSGTNTIEVLYQPPLYPQQAAINGTRIVSKSGELLEPGDIEIFVPVQVDGTAGNTASQLKAALVIVDQSALDTEQVSGVIQSLDTNILELKLAEGADPVCGVPTDPLMVGLINPLKILTVIITNDGSEILPGGILRVDQTVGMNGGCEFTGNYATDNVVIVDDQR